MTTRERLREEFELEMAYLRRVLERVPEDRSDWKPGDTSMPLGSLASFLATIPRWTKDTFARDSIDVTKEPPPSPVRTRAELLERFDRNVSEAREAIRSVDEDALQEPWSLRAGPQAIFTEPRWLVYRTYVLNHALHHRGQLMVYLRLLGIPVPAIYNDSGDEKGGMFRDRSEIGTASGTR